MKKVIYILAVVFGLGVVSCQKQNVEPCSERSHEIPEWNSSKSITSDDSINDGISSGDSAVDDGDITDPNNDPDGKGKGK